METFEEQKFDIPEMQGISKKTIEEHLKLYAGYVKNTNAILAKIDGYLDAEKLLAGSEQEDALAISELQRRFPFEFDGMRNHEFYFRHLEGGANILDSGDSLYKAITEQFEGGFDAWLARFKTIALTRGVGWAMLYYDPKTDRLLNNWNDEQHIGHLVGLSPILCLDMWEHSYLFDYTPADKKKYIEAFFDNLNWQNVQENYEAARKGR